MSAERILTEPECAALAAQVFRLREGGGEASVLVRSHWSGELRWSRNRVALASDRQDTVVNIRRTIDQASAEVTTNQLDAASLEAAVRDAERQARYASTAPDDLHGEPLFTTEYPKSSIWSDATYGLTAAERGRMARALVEPAEAQGLLSAGYLAAEAQAYAILSTQGQRLYARMTQGRCSMTVRDQRGTGSGWAGKTSYDWAKVDPAALGQRALRKCLDSRDPVALEPGRYTVILEPQAVADLLSLLIDTTALWRLPAEGDSPLAPFWLRRGFSKLGLKVADTRVTIGQDPTDPELGVLPFAGWGEPEPADPHRAVNWIENGVLTALYYPRGYAVGSLGENLGLPNSRGFRMAGGTTSVAEMIATTKRGLLVTRFSNLEQLDSLSLLSSGFTRDGLWLIENGKITKPVKNLRFTESPLFALNSLEQLGPAEPVFRPSNDRHQPLLRPAVVPPLKVRDFSFTALADAI